MRLPANCHKKYFGPLSIQGIRHHLVGSFYTSVLSHYNPLSSYWFGKFIWIERWDRACCRAKPFAKHCNLLSALFSSASNPLYCVLLWKSISGKRGSHNLLYCDSETCIVCFTATVWVFIGMWSRQNTHSKGSGSFITQL